MGGNVSIVSISVALLDAGYLRSALFQRRLATPMSPFPEFATRRSLWMWPPEKVVTTVIDDRGRAGVSVTNGGAVVGTIVRDQFARLLVGRDETDIATLWELAFRSILPFDRSGFAMMAVAAIDIALWDLRARREGRDIADLVGGRRGTPLSAYVTTLTPERYSKSKFSGIKVAMPASASDGEAGVAENIALVQRAREAAGPDRDVMLDAFMGWDVDYTIRMVEALTPFRVRWFEDPLPPTDIDAYIRLKRSCGDRITLALGNFCFSQWDCRALIESGVVSILQPDIAWAGGITEALRIDSDARRAGLPIIFHNTSEQPWALSLSQALGTVSEIEYVDRDPGSMLHEMFEDANGIVDGVLHEGSARGNALSDRAREALVPF
jgi:L-rhamnonate dehydratase